MAKSWLQERWKTLLPALQALGTAQEAEVRVLCEAEIAAWKGRPGMSKLSSLRVPMTDTRKAIKQFDLTSENRYLKSRTGEYEHIALKYMNFSEEEWREMNGVSAEKLQARLEQRQLIDHPDAIVAKAEKLLRTDRWDDLATGLSLVSGRRLTEVLKTAQFRAGVGLYSVIFEGQLKRRDLHQAPYEIPTLVDADLVLSAWRRLRSLLDCSSLENEAIAAKYSREAGVNAIRHFAGLIPQRSERENLHHHTLRAVYARIAAHWFCPVQVLDLAYVATILGHYQAKDETLQRDFAASEHYFDFAIGDNQGQIDGRQGIKLNEPGVEILAVFRPKGEHAMPATKKVEETNTPKKRGLLTTSQATGEVVFKLMEARNMHKHDEIVADLVNHDAVAHQIYALLEPLGAELEAETPIAILKALIAAYRAGTGAQALPGLGALLQEVEGEKDPAGYLSTLVQRDKKFKAGLERRYDTSIDYSTVSWADLDGHKTKAPEAAIERYRRAVNAIMEHNRTTADPLHRWYINAAIIRDLVGGRNDKVQEYLKTRAEELDEHHKEYGLTAKQNNKNMEIKDEVKVQ